MSVSYSELFSKIRKADRTSRMQVLVALFISGATDMSRAVDSSTLLKTLRLHHRGRAPGNIWDVLRKLSPHVEAIESDTSLRWWLTSSGRDHLGLACGVDLNVNVDQSISHDLKTLHPSIGSAAEALLTNRHYPEAVGRAMKALNTLVRSRSGRTADDGVRMMHQVFSRDPSPSIRLVLSPIEIEWEKDRQDGLRMIMAGVQQGIANVDKHGKLDVMNVDEAIEILGMLSYLARRVERCEILNPTAYAKKDVSYAESLNSSESAG